VSESERYLDELKRGLPPYRRGRILEEVRHHLEAAAADGQARGLSGEEADRWAVARLGSAAVMIEQFTTDLKGGAWGLTGRAGATSTRIGVLIALAATVAALAAISVLGVSHTRHRTAPTVRIYFQADATRRQENSLTQALDASPRIETVIFVSKTVALTQMTLRYPALVGDSHGNPLPDSLTVTPNKNDTQAITNHLTPLPAGVHSFSVTDSAKP
jgi:cell division protein FtsX